MAARSARAAALKLSRCAPLCCNSARCAPPRAAPPFARPASLAPPRSALANRPACDVETPIRRPPAARARLLASCSSSRSAIHALPRSAVVAVRKGAPPAAAPPLSRAFSRASDFEPAPQPDAVRPAGHLRLRASAPRRRRWCRRRKRWRALSEAEQLALLDLLQSYYTKVGASLQSAHQQLRTLERANQKATLVAKGEISEKRCRVPGAAISSTRNSLASALLLLSCCLLPCLSYRKRRKRRKESVKITAHELVITADDAGAFEDAETRAFYGDAPPSASCSARIFPFP